jgi:hypothetical protein
VEQTNCCPDVPLRPVNDTPGDVQHQRQAVLSLIRTNNRPCPNCVMQDCNIWSRDNDIQVPCPLSQVQEQQNHDFVGKSEESSFDCRQAQDTSLLCETSRPHLGPTQPPTRPDPICGPPSHLLVQTPSGAHPATYSSRPHLGPTQPPTRPGPIWGPPSHLLEGFRNRFPGIKPARA